MARPRSSTRSRWDALSEEQHPISKRLFQIYEPACKWVLEHSKTTLADRAGARGLTFPFTSCWFGVHAAVKWGHSCICHGARGDVRHPGAVHSGRFRTRFEKASRRSRRCSAKPGRADTSTDPAPLFMWRRLSFLKTEVRMAEEKSQWKRCKMRWMRRFKFWDAQTSGRCRSRVSICSDGIRTPVRRILWPDRQQIPEMIGIVQMLASQELSAASIASCSLPLRFSSAIRTSGFLKRSRLHHGKWCRVGRGVARPLCEHRRDLPGSFQNLGPEICRMDCALGTDIPGSAVGIYRMPPHLRRHELEPSMKVME